MPFPIPTHIPGRAIPAAKPKPTPAPTATGLLIQENPYPKQPGEKCLNPPKQHGGGILCPFIKIFVHPVPIYINYNPRKIFPLYI